LNRKPQEHAPQERSLRIQGNGKKKNRGLGSFCIGRKKKKKKRSNRRKIRIRTPERATGLGKRRNKTKEQSLRRTKVPIMGGKRAEKQAQKNPRLLRQELRGITPAAPQKEAKESRSFNTKGGVAVLPKKGR